MERIIWINALNPNNLTSPDDIEFDEKSRKEIVQQYILQQLQLQSKGAKYHRSMNKELRKFYIKQYIIFLSDWKGEPEEYNIKIVEKNKRLNSDTWMDCQRD